MQKTTKRSNVTRSAGRQGAAAVALGLSLLAGVSADGAMAEGVKSADMPVPTRSAFFYENPQVLNSETHATLRLRLPENAKFAAETHLVPIVASEFPDIALEYPIVFVKGGDANWMALALTGLDAGRNLFVDEAGQWDAAYIPASVRRYPFVLAGREEGKLSVAVDMACASNDKDGTPLFDAEGKPTQILQNAMSFLKSYQGQMQATRAFLARLDALGLLTPTQFELRDATGRERRLDGFFIVKEETLKELEDDTVVELFRGGHLPLIQAHLMSLRNVAALQRRAEAAPVQ